MILGPFHLSIFALPKSGKAAARVSIDTFNAQNHEA